MSLLSIAAVALLASTGADAPVQMTSGAGALLREAGVDLGIHADGATVEANRFRKIDPEFRILSRADAIVLKHEDGTPNRVDHWPRGILYVKISSVTDGAYHGLQAAVKSMTNDPPSGLLVDFRGADGRSESEAAKLASLFLPAGTPLCRILSEKGEHERTLRVAEGAQEAAGLTTVLLIDELTGGLAEMLCGALSGRKDILTLGAPSSGLSAVRDFFPLGNGRYLFIATGWTDWGKGVKTSVKPDVSLDAGAGEVAIPEPDRRGRQSAELIKLLGLTADDRSARAATDFILSRKRLAERAKDDGENTEN